MWSNGLWQDSLPDAHLRIRRRRCQNKCPWHFKRCISLRRKAVGFREAETTDKRILGQRITQCLQTHHLQWNIARRCTITNCLHTKMLENGAGCNSGTVSFQWRITPYHCHLLDLVDFSFFAFYLTKLPCIHMDHNYYHLRQFCYRIDIYANVHKDVTFGMPSLVSFYSSFLLVIKAYGACWNSIFLNIPWDVEILVCHYSFPPHPPPYLSFTMKNIV